MQWCLVLIIISINLVTGDGKKVYDFKLKDKDQNEISLDKYRGQALLIVNVASHCGYTEVTYRALDRLHDILSYGNYFSVLAFPCNQFGEQEPGTIDEIEPAMREAFGCEFPFLDKVDVIGADASPLFKFLIEQTSLVPEWNFYKYLIDAEGNVVKGWNTKTTIEDIFDDVQEAVDGAKKLKQKKGTEEETNGNDEEGKGKDEL